MAFVNEYATQEDIEKYGLEELWEKYRNANDLAIVGSKNLTIDRERNCFIIYIGNIRAPKEDRQFSAESVWVLYYEGIDIEVRLWHSAKSIAPSGPLIEVLNEKKRALEEGRIFDHIIIKQVWDLISMVPEYTKDANENELKNILKEALTVYGHRGVRSKPLLIENTIVECNW